MAANKFATMLHRKTNNITLVLVYALLEWILIGLLLLNSLFSYLIMKFADYFGLKRPCIFCTRIDHIIEPGKSQLSCKDLVCETHAKEISKLDFCLTHQKLAESQEMCEDCSSSSSQPDYVKFLKSFGLLPWMKQIGMIQDSTDKEIENGEESLRCSCCGVSLDGIFYPPSILVKPSFRILDYTQKQNLITDGEVEVDAEIDEAAHHSDRSRSDLEPDHHEDEQSIEENRKSQMVSDVDVTESCVCPVCGSGKEIVFDENYNLEVEKEREPIKEEAWSFPSDDQNCEETTVEVREKIDGIRPQHLEFFIYGDDCSLIPVELVDSPATSSRNQPKYKVGDQGHSAAEDVILDFDLLTGAEAEPLFENWRTSADIMALFSSNECKETTKINRVEPIEFKLGEIQEEEEEILEQNLQEVKIAETTEDSPKDDNVQEASLDKREEISSDVSLGSSEEETQMQNDESEAEVSIGTEIPDHEAMEEYQSPDMLLDLNQTMEEEPSTSSVRFHVQDDSGCERAEEEFVEFKAVSIQTYMPKLENNHMSSSLDLNENEEEKVPDTPTSVESLNHPHKKLQLLERKESATEDSLDESVISDLESGELTIEKLKSALEAERKALNTVYAELEEERSASAVAANQTMAMINRLQEEKAAMQMEALQYQRMMEEQSEYDQEALQLLNELMVKREKEKQGLEKELELYRKKVLEYEVREEKRLSRSNGSARSRNSSTSCSSGEDSDELSIDLNIEPKEENDLYRHEESSNENTPVDAVIYLEDSLANFEEERLSILEHLKILEEKLVMLNYEEEHFDDFKGHICEENGNGYYDHDDSDKCKVNGFANGHAKEMNGKHKQGRKILAPRGKRLLPLFDAISTETETGVFSGDENGSDFSSNCSTEKVELEKKRLALEEEVDNVYDRLQALEADREFLRHCISSTRKGDKGLTLLQEILQHLRVLRNVELRVKNSGALAA